MLDIWVDIITLDILNMARDGYGLDTRLHNDYVSEIKKKTKDNILCFLSELNAEIRRQTLEEFARRVADEGDCGNWIELPRYKMEEIVEQMKGETE